MSGMRMHARTVADIGHALRDRGATSSRVFPTSSPFPEDRSLVWAGEDLGEFLAVFQRMQGGVLYVRRQALPPGRNGDVPVVQDLAWAELAFVHDGLFHVFRNPSHDEAPRSLAEPLRARGPELLKGLLERAKDEAPDPASPKVRALLHEQAAAALGVAGSDLAEAARRDEAVGADLDALEEQARAALRDRELGLVAELAPACSAWGREHGQKSVTQGDVEAFLGERKARLGKEARRALWRKANQLLKKA